MPAHRLIIFLDDWFRLSMTQHIKHIESRLYHMPLAEALSDAMHGYRTHFELVTN
jgi:hypothetical protein